MSTATTPRTPVSPTSTATGVESTPRRRAPPLPAVKGTLAGIETPRRERDIYSPAASTYRATESPAPSTTGEIPEEKERERAPVLVFRSDPRLKTCFDGLPEGSEEIKVKFGL